MGKKFVVIASEKLLKRLAKVFILVKLEARSSITGIFEGSCLKFL